jgi:hypothetical protein
MLLWPTLWVMWALLCCMGLRHYRRREYSRWVATLIVCAPINVYLGLGADGSTHTLLFATLGVPLAEETRAVIQIANRGSFFLIAVLELLISVSLVRSVPDRHFGRKEQPQKRPENTWGTTV